MPTSNAELVRALFERINREGFDAIGDPLDPEVVWEWARSMPEAGTYHGHDEVRAAAWRFREAWNDFRFVVEDVIERGDEVFALLRYVGKGRESGVPLDTRVGHLFELRGGKVVRWRMFGDADRSRARFARG
jgi:uncharacterized protein